MKTVSANEAKQSLGKVIDEVQREPVVIQRYNRDSILFYIVYTRRNNANI